jgi:hypothetical protein
MEKRRHERIGGQNFLVDISDGAGFFTGTVKDFSRFGLQLADIPKRLDEKAQKISVVVQNNTTSFKIKARQRWTKKEAISKLVGFEITNAPWGWAEFVMDNENNPKKSIGEVSI